MSQHTYLVIGLGGTGSYSEVYSFLDAPGGSASGLDHKSAPRALVTPLPRCHACVLPSAPRGRRGEL